MKNELFKKEIIKRLALYIGLYAIIEAYFINTLTFDKSGSLLSVVGWVILSILSIYFLVYFSLRKELTGLLIVLLIIGNIFIVEYPMEWWRRYDISKNGIKT